MSDSALRSPDAFIKQMAKDIEDIVRNDLGKISAQSARRVMSSVLGFNIDSWGELTLSGSQESKILSAIDPTLLDAFDLALKNKIEREMQKFIDSPDGPLGAKLNKTVTLYIEKQIDKAIKQESDRVYETIRDAVGQRVDESLDETLQVWKVAERLQDANS
jgi:hypothetical protein